MFYYLYQITNLVNNKIYVGVHKTKDLNDGYMGSGKIIKSAIAKHGIDNFKKDILEYFDTSEVMYAREKEIVTEEFLLSEDVYNLCRGGNGGFDYINKTVDLVARNTLASRNGNIKRSKTITEMWENGLYKDRVKLDAFHESAKTAFLNKNHTDDTKRKISDKAKERLSEPKKCSQYGTMWITNGFDNKKIKKDEVIPTVWYKGRTISQ